MTDTNRLADLEANLSKELKAAYEKTQQPIPAEIIATIVREVIASLSGDITASDLKFYTELENLAAYIRHAKIEIAEIRPKDINVTYIPHATDELDAVVGATEDATNKIMDVCDRISAIAPSCPPEISEQLIACTTSIFEACNFQDITGQRITKVVQALKHIDVKVEALLKALGEEIHHSSTKDPQTLDDAAAEKALLNGPQLPKNAIDQDAIDKLLSGE